jgi:hypothetical protein
VKTHIHLLVRSGQQGVTALMRKLLTWYAHSPLPCQGNGRSCRTCLTIL